MANNFLIDGAQSAGTIAQNIFNGATKDNSLLNKNFLSQGMMLGEGFLGLDFGQIETPEMKEYLKELSINRIKENGNLQGNQLGYSDYDDKAPWSKPDSLKTSTGFTSPNAAIQNTLGASGFRVPETGGKVSFDSSGTNYDFGKGLGGLFGGLNPFNIINRGGLKDILLKDEEGTYNKGPLKGQSSLQNFTPNIEITPEEIQDIFGGGKLVHKGEGVQDRPEISSYNQEQAEKKKSREILADQSRRQQGQISKPPLAVVTPQTPQATKQTGMMSSGPKRRSSRGSRRKAVAKPSRSNYSRKYSRLVGGR